MFNIRYLTRLFTAFIKRFKGLIILSAVVGIFIFFVLRLTIPLIFAGSTERIGITGRYHTDELPSTILNSISDGLTRVNDQGIPEPNLARAWESPDNGKTWIFHLKEDAVWQNGEPVTSDSIVYEFSDVEIKRPDPKTIIFELQDTFSPFSVVVSKPTFRRGLLGTGEWEVKKVRLTSGYVQELELADNNKNKKIYKFYPTSDRTKLAFKLGEVDKVQNLIDPAPIGTWETAELAEKVNENQVVTVFFNTQEGALSEKSLRQALTYAINKEKLGQRAINPISPNSWAYNSQVKRYEYDKERAKELLSDMPQEAIDNIEVKLVSTPALLPTAEQIADDWREVGINTIIQVSSIIPTEYQAYITIYDIPKDPDQYSIWHSTQTSTNISKYSNPRIDKLLEDGRSTLDIEERRSIYLDFQRFLLEDLPAAFLYHPMYHTVTRK